MSDFGDAEEEPTVELLIDSSLSTKAYEAANAAGQESQRFEGLEWVWAFAGLRRLGQKAWTFMPPGMHTVLSFFQSFFHAHMMTLYMIIQASTT